MERPMTFTMMGVRVSFPFPPYESQISMVNRVIKACKRMLNVAIECPTGCGKTLGILSGLLAWQEHELREVEKYNSQLQEDFRLQERSIYNEPPVKSIPSVVNSPKVQTACCCNTKATSPTTSNTMFIAERLSHRPKKKPRVVPQVIILDSDDESDFKDINKPGFQAAISVASCGDEAEQKTTPCLSCACTQKLQVQEDPDVIFEGEYSKEPRLCEPSTENVMPPRVVKIYYSTRTHRQIKQVVRELRKSNYKNVRMTVLSSREHTCIRDMEGIYTSRTEMCSDLLDPKTKRSSCRFHQNASRISSHENLEDRGFSTPWDIEDIVSLGKSCNACPYFAARDLMDSAQLILCPYNYLVDPTIRESMKISLHGAIVVIDEAHNLENTCLEGASMVLFIDSLDKAEEELKNLNDPELIFFSMVLFLSKLRRWVEANKQVEKHMTGTELVASFNNANLTISDLQTFKTNTASSSDPEKQEIMITSNTRFLCEKLVLVLGYLFKSHTDFYAFFDSTIKPRGQDRETAGPTNWRERKKTFLALHILCMNPSLLFSEIETEARCVILASGTLSPLDALAKELGTKFGDTLISGHVISPEQLWVGCLSQGPSGHTLNGRFDCSRTFEYMDDVGTLVLQVCQRTPHGVLCFLPSYGFMRNLLDRWRSTQLLSKMGVYKDIVVESQFQEEFDKGMASFFHSIQRSTHESQSQDTCTGALLFAVMRGKVSEGVDFADNDARAIITVGIPYPQIKDKGVLLKKEFNNLNTSKGFVTGNEWYQVQAFRAMNQALGRGLRHKGDWCALLIVDERFLRGNTMLTRLPQWIRKETKMYSECDQMLSSLFNFARSRVDASENKSVITIT